MTAVKILLIVCIVLTLLEYHQCGRYGGNEEDEKSEVEPVLSVDEPKPPPPPALAYRTTRRTTARPRTTARRHEAVRQTTRRATTPRPTTRRTTTPRPTTRRTTTPRPTTRRTTMTTRRTTTTPRPTTRHTTTPRPTTRYTTPRYTTSTRRTTTPFWVADRTRGTTRRPPTTPRRTTTTRRWTTPRPQKKEYPVYQQLPPLPGKGGKPPKQKIVIKNTYNYHYPGFYTIPVAHHEHPGYYRTYSSYHYSHTDTGDGLLGFYIGYKLAKLTTPTYSHYSFYDGYRPRYDHYTVHHYYHNADSVPKQQRVVSNAIVGCVGDSTSVCPTGTVSLCTSDGTLMCVVSAAKIVDCTDANNRQTKCTKSTISCENNEAAECKGATTGSVSVDIPCVSTAKVEGAVKYVNNTVVKTSPEELVTNCTRIVSCVNNTSPECVFSDRIHVNSSCVIGSTTVVNGSHCVAIMPCLNNTSIECVNKTSTIVDVTCPLEMSSTPCLATVPCASISSPQCANRSTIVLNATCSHANSTHLIATIPCANIISPACANKTTWSTNCTSTNQTSTVTCGTTQSGMTYLNNPLSGTTTPPTTSDTFWKWKRSIPDPATDFCVAVIAVPAKREPTKGEEFLRDANSILTKFIESAWNL